MSLIDDYKTFLDDGKTERECVDKIVALAKNAGFRAIEECDSLKAGDKVFSVKMGKAVALFVIGSQDISRGMNILGAHIDSPRLDVKQNPIYEDNFLVYMNTHYYGGIKKYQWVALPLAIHGVVCLKNGTSVRVRVGEDDGDPVFCISDILPHLAQKQMKESASEFIPGEKLDVILGSGIPEKKTEDDDAKKEKKESAKKKILNLLKEKYGIEEDDFGSAELEVVPAGKARDLGFDRSLILAYGQDDRSCAYTSARAIFEAQASERTLCCVCVDKDNRPLQVVCF